MQQATELCAQKPQDTDDMAGDDVAATQRSEALKGVKPGMLEQAQKEAQQKICLQVRLCPLGLLSFMLFSNCVVLWCGV